MTYRGLALKTRERAGWIVVLLGFSIPVSIASDGILAGLLLLAWLVAIRIQFQTWQRTTLREPAVVLALLLFALLLLSMTYSGVGWKPAWSSASKYLDLALIPVFAWAAFAPAIRRRALFAFLIAIALTLVISFGTALGLWDSVPGLYTRPHYPIGFKLSVTHNILVTLAAFVLLLLARDLYRDHRRWSVTALLFALACIYNVLFIVIGRTGYILVAVLLVYFATTVIRNRRGALLATLAITALFASAYFGSQFFPARVQDVASDLAQWKADAKDATSVGQRISYYRTSLQIIMERPLTGVGAGGFAPAYAEKVRDSGAQATVNPHNDYLMIAAQGGVPALCLLLALYVTLWRRARTLPSPLERDILRGLVLTIAIGGLFNSLLMDHVEGLLFAWGVGVLFSTPASGNRQ